MHLDNKLILTKSHRRYVSKKNENRVRTVACSFASLRLAYNFFSQNI